MPPVKCAAEPVPVDFAPAWAPATLTSRGTAAARLSNFQDQWAELTAEDRAWFAWWLTELLVDACEGEPS